MNKHLEQLVKLSQFDKEIVDFEPKIQNEQEKLQVFTQTVEDLKSQAQKALLSIDDLKNKRMKNDIHLKELSDKLEETAKKHNEIKTEKELKALQLEEEIAKEQIAFANEEITRLDNLIESKTKELEEINAQITEEEDTVAELKTATDAKIAEYEASRGVVYEEKSVLISQVDTKVLAFYEKIKRWAKERAVVPVKNQACYGCHMKLSDRFYTEFIHSDEIKTCPHCGRIIYFAETEE